MTFEAILVSALGQLLAAGILVGCWLVWKTAVLVYEIAKTLRTIKVQVIKQK